MSRILAGIWNSDHRVSPSMIRSNCLLFLLLIALHVGITTPSIISLSRKSATSKPTNSVSHAILRSSCSSTLYPDLCFSSIASAPALTTSLTTHKDVIIASLNLTISAVDHLYFTVQKIIHRGGLNSREKSALHDCLEDVDLTLDDLHRTVNDLQKYPEANLRSRRNADDLKTLLSAAMTNQESCIDGFSHDRADKKVREELLKGLDHVRRMCSNGLAMVCNMTYADVADASGRRLREEAVIEGEEGFPWWLSAGDRRLLQASTLTPNVVVAADGSGNFRTVSAAVAASPERSTTRYVIKIKAGVYRENVEVPKKKTNLMFVGDGRTNTIITGDRNVVDGSTTFNSATVAIVGEGFLARDITFQNTAGPSKHQAVALRVNADLCAFYQCDILAYQDTLYVHSLRQFYRSCLIAGTVDFIFGNAAVVIQDCDIHARRPNAGQRNMVTAQGRDDPNQNTGISIHQSRIGATSDLLAVKSNFYTYLGRPWKQYSRTVIVKSDISDVIDPAGWYPWDGNFALDTLYYAEYQNTGAGAGTTKRITWKGYKVITNVAEAQQFTVDNFIGGSNWLGSTRFPFAPGL